MLKGSVQPGRQYILDEFDDEFPEQYNTLHEQARLNREHKECDLAKIGRKLKMEPDYGDTLRDPSRLMRRTSRVETRGGASMQSQIDRMTMEIKSTKRRTTMLKNQRFHNTPQHRRKSMADMKKARAANSAAQQSRAAEIERFKEDHQKKDLAYRISFDKYDVDHSGYIDADELATALADCADCRHVFVDCAGTGPADSKLAALLPRLAAMKEGPQPLQTLLVLPANVQREDLLGAIARFAPAAPVAAALTKIDECSRFGGALSALIGTRTPLAWLADIAGDDAGVADRLNPDGGAIALGHPLGGSGARIMTTLVHHMRDNGIRYGLQTMCEGGGQANATILELL